MAESTSTTSSATGTAAPGATSSTSNSSSASHHSIITPAVFEEHARRLISTPTFHISNDLSSSASLSATDETSASGASAGNNSSSKGQGQGSGGGPSSASDKDRASMITSIRLREINDIREKIELVHTSAYGLFVKHILPALKVVLEQTEPVFVHGPTQQLRSGVLEILYRMPHNDFLRPLAHQMMHIAINVFVNDNQENAIVALKIIFELHKNFRPMLEDTVQLFLDNVVALYQNIDNIALTMQQSNDNTSSSSSSTNANTISSSSSNQTDSMVDATPVPGSPIPKAKESFKALSECPLIVMLLFQLYPKCIRGNLSKIVPLMLKLLALNPVIVSEDNQAKGQLNNNLLLVQVKTLSFITYIVRSYGSEMKPHESLVASGVVLLLRVCPTSSILLRKELLIATRHIFTTEFREGFTPFINILLDEDLFLGVNQNSPDTITPEQIKSQTSFQLNPVGGSAKGMLSIQEKALQSLAFSTFADFVHHTRPVLSLAQISRVVYIFSRNIHDLNIPLSVQTVSIRLLLNIVENIFHNTEQDVLKARSLLVRVLDVMVRKVESIQYLIPYLYDIEKKLQSINELERTKPVAQPVNMLYLTRASSSSSSSSSSAAQLNQDSLPGNLEKPLRVHISKDGFTGANKIKITQPRLDPDSLSDDTKNFIYSGEQNLNFLFDATTNTYAMSERELSRIATLDIGDNSFAQLALKSSAKEIKSLFRTIILGLKTVLWCITNHGRKHLTAYTDISGVSSSSTNPSMQSSGSSLNSSTSSDEAKKMIMGILTEAENSLVSTFFQQGLKCLILFGKYWTNISEKAKHDMKMDLSNVSKGDDEILLLENFAGIFCVLEAYSFTDIFQTNLLFLLRSVNLYPYLFVIPACILKNPNVSRHFSAILLPYIYSQLSCLLDIRNQLTSLEDMFKQDVSQSIHALNIPLLLELYDLVFLSLGALARSGASNFQQVSSLLKPCIHDYCMLILNLVEKDFASDFVYPVFSLVRNGVFKYPMVYYDDKQTTDFSRHHEPFLLALRSLLRCSESTVDMNKSLSSALSPVVTSLLQRLNKLLVHSKSLSALSPTRNIKESLIAEICIYLAHYYPLSNSKIASSPNQALNHNYNSQELFKLMRSPLEVALASDSYGNNELVRSAIDLLDEWDDSEITDVDAIANLLQQNNHSIAKLLHQLLKPAPAEHGKSVVRLLGRIPGWNHNIKNDVEIVNQNITKLNLNDLQILYLELNWRSKLHNSKVLIELENNIKYAAHVLEKLFEPENLINSNFSNEQSISNQDITKDLLVWKNHINGQLSIQMPDHHDIHSLSTKNVKVKMDCFSLFASCAIEIMFQLNDLSIFPVSIFKLLLSSLITSGCDKDLRSSLKSGEFIEFFFAHLFYLQKCHVGEEINQFPKNSIFSMIQDVLLQLFCEKSGSPIHSAMAIRFLHIMKVEMQDQFANEFCKFVESLSSNVLDSSFAIRMGSLIGLQYLLNSSQTNDLLNNETLTKGINHMLYSLNTLEESYGMDVLLLTRQVLLTLVKSIKSRADIEKENLNSMFIKSIIELERSMMNAMQSTKNQYTRGMLAIAYKDIRDLVTEMQKSDMVQSDISKILQDLSQLDSRIDIALIVSKMETLAFLFEHENQYLSCNLTLLKSIKEMYQGIDVLLNNLVLASYEQASLNTIAEWSERVVLISGASDREISEPNAPLNGIEFDHALLCILKGILTLPEGGHHINQSIIEWVIYSLFRGSAKCTSVANDCISLITKQQSVNTLMYETQSVLLLKFAELYTLSKAKRFKYLTSITFMNGLKTLLQNFLQYYQDESTFSKNCFKSLQIGLMHCLDRWLDPKFMLSVEVIDCYVGKIGKYQDFLVRCSKLLDTFVAFPSELLDKENIDLICTRVLQIERVLHLYHYHYQGLVTKLNINETATLERVTSSFSIDVGNQNQSNMDITDDNANLSSRGSRSGSSDELSMDNSHSSIEQFDQALTYLESSCLPGCNFGRLSSPLRTPLTELLNSVPLLTIQYFLQENRLTRRLYSTLFTDILKYPKSTMIRDEIYNVSNSAWLLLNSTFDIASNNPNKSTDLSTESDQTLRTAQARSMELKFQGVRMIRCLCKANPTWLLQEPSVIKTIVTMWKSRDRQHRLKLEEQLPLRHQSLSRDICEILVSFIQIVRESQKEPGELYQSAIINLFELVSILPLRTSSDFSFLHQYFQLDLAAKSTKVEKKMIIEIFVDLVDSVLPSQDPSSSNDSLTSSNSMVIEEIENKEAAKTKYAGLQGDEMIETILRIIIIPTLVSFFNSRKPEEQVSDILPDPLMRRLVNCMIMSATASANKSQRLKFENFNHQIFCLDPDAAAEMLDIQWLQLSTLLISHCGKELMDFRKDLIKFAWNYLRKDECESKLWAYVNICTFIDVYVTPPEIILQVYVALLKQHNTESNDLVRRAIDILLPALPRALPLNKYYKALKWTKKLVFDEGHNLPQIVHTWGVITRHPQLFYQYRAHLVPLMVNSLNRIGLPQNCTYENRRLSIDVAELILSWESTHDILSSRTSHRKNTTLDDGDSKHSSSLNDYYESTIVDDPLQGYRLNPILLTMVLHFLLREALQLSEVNDNDSRELYHRCIKVFKVGLMRVPSCVQYSLQSDHSKTDSTHLASSSSASVLRFMYIARVLVSHIPKLKSLAENDVKEAKNEILAVLNESKENPSNLGVSPILTKHLTPSVWVTGTEPGVICCILDILIAIADADKEHVLDPFLKECAGDLHIIIEPSLTTPEKQAKTKFASLISKLLKTHPISSRLTPLNSDGSSSNPSGSSTNQANSQYDQQQPQPSRKKPFYPALAAAIHKRILYFADESNFDVAQFSSGSSNDHAPTATTTTAASSSASNETAISQNANEGKPSSTNIAGSISTPVPVEGSDSYLNDEKARKKKRSRQSPETDDAGNAEDDRDENQQNKQANKKKNKAENESVLQKTILQSPAEQVQQNRPIKKSKNANEASSPGENSSTAILKGMNTNADAKMTPTSLSGSPPLSSSTAPNGQTDSESSLKINATEGDPLLQRRARVKSFSPSSPNEPASVPSAQGLLATLQENAQQRMKKIAAIRGAEHICAGPRGIVDTLSLLQILCYCIEPKPYPGADIVRSVGFPAAIEKFAPSLLKILNRLTKIMTITSNLKLKGDNNTSAKSRVSTPSYGSHTSKSSSMHRSQISVTDAHDAAGSVDDYFAVTTKSSLITIHLLGMRLSSLGDNRRQFLQVLASLLDKLDSTNALFACDVISLLRSWFINDVNAPQKRSKSGKSRVLQDQQTLLSSKEQYVFMNKIIDLRRRFEQYRDPNSRKVIYDCMELVYDLYKPKMEKLKISHYDNPEAFLLQLKSQKKKTEQTDDTNTKDPDSWSDKLLLPTFLSAGLLCDQPEQRKKFQRSILCMVSSDPHSCIEVFSRIDWSPVAEKFWIPAAVYILASAMEINDVCKLQQRVLGVNSNNIETQFFNDETILCKSNFFSQLRGLISSSSIILPLLNLSHTDGSGKIAKSLFVSLFASSWNATTVNDVHYPKSRKEKLTRISLDLEYLASRSFHIPKSSWIMNILNTKSQILAMLDASNLAKREAEKSSITSAWYSHRAPMPFSIVAYGGLSFERLTCASGAILSHISNPEVLLEGMFNSGQFGGVSFTLSPDILAYWGKTHGLWPYLIRELEKISAESSFQQFSYFFPLLQEAYKYMNASSLESGLVVSYYNNKMSALTKSGIILQNLGWSNEALQVFDYGMKWLKAKGTTNLRKIELPIYPYKENPTVVKSILDDVSSPDNIFDAFIGGSGVVREIEFDEDIDMTEVSIHSTTFKTDLIKDAFGLETNKNEYYKEMLNYQGTRLNAKFIDSPTASVYNQNVDDQTLKCEFEIWRKKWIECHRSISLWDSLFLLGEDLSDARIMLGSTLCSLSPNWKKIRSLFFTSAVAASADFRDPMVGNLQVCLAIQERRPFHDLRNLWQQAALVVLQEIASTSIEDLPLPLNYRLNGMCGDNNFSPAFLLQNLVELEESLVLLEYTGSRSSPGKFAQVHSNAPEALSSFERITHSWRRRAPKSSDDTFGTCCAIFNWRLQLLGLLGKMLKSNDEISAGSGSDSASETITKEIRSTILDFSMKARITKNFSLVDDLLKRSLIGIPLPNQEFEDKAKLERAKLNLSYVPDGKNCKELIQNNLEILDSIITSQNESSQDNNINGEEYLLKALSYKTLIKLNDGIGIASIDSSNLCELYLQASKSPNKDVSGYAFAELALYLDAIKNRETIRNFELFKNSPDKSSEKLIVEFYCEAIQRENTTVIPKVLSYCMMSSQYADIVANKVNNVKIWREWLPFMLRNIISFYPILKSCFTNDAHLFSLSLRSQIKSSIENPSRFPVGVERYISRKFSEKDVMEIAETSDITATSSKAINSLIVEVEQSDPSYFDELKVLQEFLYQMAASHMEVEHLRCLKLIESASSAVNMLMSANSKKPNFDLGVRFIDHVKQYILDISAHPNAQMEKIKSIAMELLDGYKNVISNEVIDMELYNAWRENIFILISQARKSVDRINFKEFAIILSKKISNVELSRFTNALLPDSTNKIVAFAAEKCFIDSDCGNSIIAFLLESGSYQYFMMESVTPTYVTMNDQYQTLTRKIIKCLFVDENAVFEPSNVTPISISSDIQMTPISINSFQTTSSLATIGALIPTSIKNQKKSLDTFFSTGLQFSPAQYFIFRDNFISSYTLNSFISLCLDDNGMSLCNPVNISIDLQCGKMTYVYGHETTFVINPEVYRKLPRIRLSKSLSHFITQQGIEGEMAQKIAKYSHALVTESRPLYTTSNYKDFSSNRKIELDGSFELFKMEKIKLPVIEKENNIYSKIVALSPSSPEIVFSMGGGYDNPQAYQASSSSASLCVNNIPCDNVAALIEESYSQSQTNIPNEWMPWL